MTIIYPSILKIFILYKLSHITGGFNNKKGTLLLARQFFFQHYKKSPGVLSVPYSFKQNLPQERSYVHCALDKVLCLKIWILYKFKSWIILPKDFHTSFCSLPTPCTACFKFEVHCTVSPLLSYLCATSTGVEFYGSLHPQTHSGSDSYWMSETEIYICFRAHLM